MEFRLNKIDTDIRRKIDDKTKDGKVHSKLGLKIENDNYKEKKENQNKSKKKLEKTFKEEVEKATITIDALKSKEYKVDENCLGVFIDTKK
jgi:hypothetical protein